MSVLDAYSSRSQQYIDLFDGDGDAHEVDAAFAAARREGLSYFGAETVYVERYLDGPKHMEVQILSPAPGESMALGVRDCSLQRGYQKLIEESPPPRWAGRIPEMSAAAVALSNACGYVNAGTVEFLVDDDGCPYFLEVNARLQVEHTVTEEVNGIDLVACQLRIASGDPLEFSGADIEARGHAIECRVNAEDPARGFMPSPGTITTYGEPGGGGVRVDSGYGAGDTVPDAYDSLVAKLIVWGGDRTEARARMLRSLDDFVIEGIRTNLGALRLLVTHETFSTGRHTTTTLVEDVRHLALDIVQEARKLGPDVHVRRVPELLDESCHAFGTGRVGRRIHPIHDTSM